MKTSFFFFKVTSQLNSKSHIFAGVTIRKILFSFMPIFQCHNLSELLLIASDLSENKILTVCFVIFHSILFFPLCYSVSGNCDISYHKKHSCSEIHFFWSNIRQFSGSAVITPCFSVITYSSIYFNHQFSTQEFCISHLQSLMFEKVKNSSQSFRLCLPLR